MNLVSLASFNIVLFVLSGANLALDLSDKVEDLENKQRIDCRYENQLIFSKDTRYAES